MQDIFYFGAGPAALPRPVLEKIRREFLNCRGTGLSVIELPHRGEVFSGIRKDAESLLRELMQIPEDYAVLFMHGGATGQFSMLPLNFLGSGRSADYVCTGYWSARAAEEAKRLAGIREIHALHEEDGLSIAPEREWSLDPQATYLHYCDNETVEGIAFPGIPDTPRGSLVCDMTSSVLMRPVEISRFAVLYAGAQKNLGIAGLCVVIIRKEWVDLVNEQVPRLNDYRRCAREQSMVNTPPVFAIYVLQVLLDWVKSQGGVQVMHERSLRRAGILYGVLDSSRLYRNRVVKEFRSRINVPFEIRDKGLQELFLAEAGQNGLHGLRGHRSAGGVRASLYNAMPDAGVERLAEFMRDFEIRHLDRHVSG